MRRTKIIATLGPATDDPKILADVINAGADVLRINFSHGSPAEHKRSVAMVRKLETESGKYIGILGDLQGTKTRIRRFKKSPVILKEGQEFVLDCAMAADAGTNKAVGVAYDVPVAPGADPQSLGQAHLPVGHVPGGVRPRPHPRERRPGVLLRREADRVRIRSRGPGRALLPSSVPAARTRPRRLVTSCDEIRLPPRASQARVG